MGNISEGKFRDVNVSILMMEEKRMGVQMTTDDINIEVEGVWGHGFPNNI